MTPGSIALRYTHGVVFADDNFLRLGAAGIELSIGSQSNTIDRCVFADISGSAIEIGEAADSTQGPVIAHHPDDPRQIVADNAVMRSVVTRVGAEYPSSVGIWVLYTHYTVLDHNTVTDLPYTGISVGWGWGRVDPPCEPCIKDPTGVVPQGSPDPGYPTPSTSSDNQVTGNRIERLLQPTNNGTQMQDGGGIYTLGMQPGTLVSRNYIADVGGSLINPGNPTQPVTNPSVGIYLDQGTRHTIWTQNVIDNAAAWVVNVKVSENYDDLVTANYFNTQPIPFVPIFFQNYPVDLLLVNTWVPAGLWRDGAREVIDQSGAPADVVDRVAAS